VAVDGDRFVVAPAKENNLPKEFPTSTDLG
jgi:hypothetical protein